MLMLRIYTFPFLSLNALEVKNDAPICILKLPLGGRETLDHLGKTWCRQDTRGRDLWEPGDGLGMEGA